MAVDAAPIQAVRWDGRRLAVLDQTRLPHEEVWLSLTGAQDTAQAIRRLAVRGAPNIGIAAAYGLAMELSARPSLGALEAASELLSGARPTAVNLAAAVARVRTAALGAGPSTLASAARAEAQRLHADEDAASAALAAHGADVLASARTILTHCNTGALATGGRGSGLAVILELAARHEGVRVLACETRPLLQGARLTAWELTRLGIPFALIVDGAAAGLLRRGEADAVVVGCDRVAANGDVANKVGTYAHALAARAAGLPFVVAGPTSTIDLATPDGDAIEIEERDGAEVSELGGVAIAPAGTPVRNPAFDVTPAGLVTALVTERGVARDPDTASVAALAARP
ncbi:S-methyl-5-thioribose-1-phosphate isomerase [Baekduia soli]|uniref:Methylthioribose-1-phosphate isomerase n=1 Tax=Baekduia soli TaxID=496014 RepID=A0A5B8UC32_9ACTN|nr:S-methyl-5-thioribose-1-phosphate isomerase [Baekduia soli]QEC50202.1 S-methyl-5-thioribose-1-phosphate isomerase [Baekduia soli]